MKFMLFRKTVIICTIESIILFSSHLYIGICLLKKKRNNRLVVTIELQLTLGILSSLKKEIDYKLKLNIEILLLVKKRCWSEKVSSHLYCGEATFQKMVRKNREFHI